MKEFSSKNGFELESEADGADSLLIRQVLQGSGGAFQRLMEKHYRKILNQVRRQLKDPNDALDVAQEIFWKAYRGLSQFRGECPFYLWLHRIARNSVNNYLVLQRKQARLRPDSVHDGCFEPQGGQETGYESETPESLLNRSQIRVAIGKATNELPPGLKEAFIYREIEGFDYEEIADRLACPLGTVRSRLSRARIFVATQLRTLLPTHHPAVVRSGKTWPNG